MDGPEFTAQWLRLNTATQTAVLSLWDQLDSWRDRDAERFVAQAVPLIQAGQGTVAALTSLFMADQASEYFDVPVPPPEVPLEVVTTGRGVPAEQVYQRPFVDIYTALSQGRPLSTAVALGRTRLDEIADLDMQRAYGLAAREAMDNLPDEYRPRYWRRVTTGRKTCALCIVASTQIYSRGDLRRIHRRCDCRVEPDYSGRTGRKRAGVLLERVHAAVRELTGEDDRGARNPDYRQILVEISAEHGELGPLLVRPGDRYTGPVGLDRKPAPTPEEQRATRRRQVEQQIAALEPTFASLKARRDAGENVDTPYRYQRDLLKRLRAELASL